MPKTTFLECVDCGHCHELTVETDEFGTWVDVPDACEDCGAEFGNYPSELSNRQTERRQMGICD